jgi:exopolyphosphatase/guanosine-5'-triphosphate,3'-diphosphate pyrophosphatase
MYYGILDIGSNSVRLVIYDKKKNKISAIFNEKRSVGQADELQRGFLSEEGCQLLVDTIDQFCNIAQVFRVDHLLPFATAYWLEVENHVQVMERIKKQLGLAVDIMNAKDEARYEYVGVEASGFLTVKSSSILDISSLSSRIINCHKREYQESITLPFGSLSLSNQFVRQIPPTKEELEAICAFVRLRMMESHVQPLEKKNVLVGVGSTARMIARIDRVRKGVQDPSHTYHLTPKALGDIYDSAMNNPPQAQQQFGRVSSSRTRMILPGIMAFYHMSSFLQPKKIIISRFGVREGYLISKLEQEYGERFQMVPPEVL